MGLKSIVKPVFVVSLGFVLYLIASNVGAGWLYVVVAAILGLVLVSIPLPWLGVRRIGVARRAPVVATAGEPFECALELENTGRLPRYMIEVADRFAGDEGRAVAVRVRRGRPETVGYTVENPRRGIYAGGEVVVESRAPFGLFYGRRKIRVASDTVIYPRTFDVAGLPPSPITDAERGDRERVLGAAQGARGRVLGRQGLQARGPSPAGRLEEERPRPGLREARRHRARQGDAAPVRARDGPRRRRPVRGQGDGRLGGGLTTPLRPRRRPPGKRRRRPGQPTLPRRPTPDNVLTWCAGLRASKPPATQGASVEIRPSTRRNNVAEKPDISGTSEAQAIVLVSCHEFEGAGPWMSPEQERKFTEDAEASGRKVALLGPEVEEPWRI